MPELPEVETMCRGIAPIVGSRIADVVRPKSRLQSIIIEPRLDALRRRVRERRVERIGRLGKRVVVHLEGDDRLVIEPRMTGLVLLREPPNASHVRLIFALSGGRVEQFLFWDQRGLGVVRLLDPSGFERYYGQHLLGPDALEISVATLCERLGRSRRPIKVALMDQQALTGIGNLYASEILFHAGIHPRRPCHRLRPDDWDRIHVQMRRVLLKAIRCEGSTLTDGTYRVGREQVGGYQLHHQVYGRAGEPCNQCGQAQVERIVQAQRSTFFCPVCQVPQRRQRKR
jgi:formamidopyrimidine-DNA glycosylase